MDFRRNIHSSDGKLSIYLDSTSLVPVVSNNESCDLVGHFIVSWITLLSDSPLNTSHGLKPRRVFTKFYREITSTAIKDSIAKYSDLMDRLMANATIFGSGSVTGDFIPEFMDTPIFKEYHEWYKTGNPVILRYVLSFLRFGKKLKYADESFNARAFRSWLEVEERLSRHVYDDKLIALLRLVIHKLFSAGNTGISTGVPPQYREYHVFRGAHGPGAVADGRRGIIAKSKQLRYHPRLEKVITSMAFGYDHDNPGLLEKVIPDYPAWSADRRHDHHVDDVSHLRFVPKNTKTARSICMEPTSFMYFQQSYMLELISRLGDTVLGRMITLRDQSRNQLLAEYGSWSGNVDTIDLSAASDSLTVELVRRVFPRDILFALLATRTTKVLGPDGVVRHPVKFAPMGSALCFPVQSITFASIVILSMIVHHCEIHGLDVREFISTSLFEFLDSEIAWSIGDTTRTYHCPSVYGDDIVCDYKVTDTVRGLLTAFGFTVNTEKSFTSSQAFRESCGKFYWNGSDVTPLMYSIPLFKGRHTPQSVESCIATCNNTGDYGYFNTRSFYIQDLLGSRMPLWRSGVPNQLIFSENREDTGKIFSTDAHNRHLRRRRYNISLQREEARVIKVVSSDSEVSYDTVTNKGRYIQWQRTNLSCGVLADDFVRPWGGDSHDLRIKWGWTPI